MEKSRKWEGEKKRIDAEVKKALGGANRSQIADFLKTFSQDSLPQALQKVVEIPTITFIGKGSSAEFDRILIRSIVHHCQGIKDPILGKVSPTEFFNALNPDESEDGIDPVTFGERTAFALKKITVFAPCELAPLRDSEWI